MLVGSSVLCVGCISDAQGLGRLECAFLSHRLPVALSSRPQEARALLGVVPAITPAPSVSEKKELAEDLIPFGALSAVWVMGTPHS